MLPPLTWVALAFLSGLVIAEITILPISACFAATAGIIMLWITLSLARKPRFWLVRKHTHLGLPPILLVLSCAIGIVRMQMTSLPISSSDLSWYNNRGVVTIKGEICGYPDRRDTFQLLTVDASSLSTVNNANTLAIDGRLIIRTGIDASWVYGDEVLLTGRLTTPSNESDFSYRDYLARQSIHSTLYYPEIVLITRGHGNPLVSRIYSIRDKGLSILSRVFPMPESALLSGILLGVDNDIPASIQTAFRVTGTTHIIAISGFNISILAALFSSVFYRLLGTRKGALATTLTLFVYVILCGASPSVVRAAIMGSLGLFASLVGRRQVGINSLAFVAMLMCLFNPYLPWDVSFQLSFLSTLGLILFAEPMVNWLKTFFTRFPPTRSLESLAEKIGEYCFFTFAALIMTFPVMAYHFQSLSWLSLVTNPLILPVQPLVMILGGLSLLLGMIWLPLGQLVAYLAWPFVAYTIKLVEWLSNLAGNSSGSLSVGMGFVFFFYLALGLYCFNQKGVLIKRILQPNLIILVCLAVTVWFWRTGLNMPDQKLHVYIIENGPSDSLLIRSPEGRYLLINAGSQSTTLANALGEYLPPGNRELDIVFLPVSDKQAIRALRHGVSGISIDTLVWLGDPSGMATARDLENNIDIRTTNITDNKENLVYRLSPGASLTFHPLQNTGGFFTLQWEDFRMLVPLEVDDTTWLETVLSEDTPCCYTALLLADNGGFEFNPPAQIRRLNPALILITSNPGQINEISLSESQNGILLTTERNGWVHIMTDGSQLWVETARNPE
jgi:competence protein ComEC